MSSTMKAELFCLHCNKDTPHEITYVADSLKSIRCLECCSEIEIKREILLENYAADFIDRILTKPYRMTRELEQDITKFILSLPIRIITKPYRIAKEVGHILQKDASHKAGK